METTKLRKVSFTLNGVDVFGYKHLNIGDQISGDKNPEIYDKVQNGLFHTWGCGIQTDENGNNFAITFAIVELDNGQIVEVPPMNIQFLD